MIDEIVETALPWGAWIAIGALAGAAFPQESRSALKAALRTGFRLADWAREAGAEAYEKGQDVYAEARAEYEQLVREAQREAERRELHVIEGKASRRRPAGRRRAERG